MPPRVICIETSESSKSLSSKNEGESTLDPSQSNTNARSDSSTSADHLAAKETVIVNRAKLVVHISLLVASVAIAVGAFFFVRSKEESEFQGEVSRTRVTSWASKIKTNDLTTQSSISFLSLLQKLSNDPKQMQKTLWVKFAVSPSRSHPIQVLWVWKTGGPTLRYPTLKHEFTKLLI
jgi:hypothetical protein